jgi:hypothetical protein
MGSYGTLFRGLKSAGLDNQELTAMAQAMH